MPYVMLALLVALAGLAILFAPALLPWMVGSTLGLFLLGLFHRTAEQLVGTVLSPAEDLRGLPALLDPAQERIRSLSAGLRGDAGPDGARMLVQRVLGAFIHLGFAVLALAAEQSLFFPLWELWLGVSPPRVELLAGTPLEALAPYAFVLAMPVFFLVLTDLFGWTHLGPWSTGSTRSRQASGVVAAIGLGVTVVLLIAASQVRSTALAPLPDPSAVPMGAEIAFLSDTPPADLSVLSAPPPTVDAADRDVGSFDRDLNMAGKVASVASVLVLVAAGFFAGASLVELTLILALLAVGLAGLIVLLAKLALELVAWALYWAARVIQVIFFLMSRMAVALARPAALQFGLRDTDLDDAPAAGTTPPQAVADPTPAGNPRPQAPGRPAERGHAADDAAADLSDLADATPGDEDDTPSRNWRPFT